jgi:hypothetical protein
MALDSRYVIASDLLSAFFDKDTGEPLSDGVIKFYKDQARTEPKDVFQLSGAPPNYTYTNLGNEITLSATGLMQNDDTGQIIILLYFPYEGTPDDSDGTLELYYVTCENEDEEEQWTREGWPYVTVETTQEQNFVNFAPNGQFLLHNNVPATESNDHIAGKITGPVTVIAQGGWTFERPVDSSATDIVTFEAFESAVSNPSANPKFRLRVQCQSPSAGDDRKDICLKFTDVNKFASDTQKYTYAFTGLSNETGSVSAALILIKNYGTGGDPQEEFPISNVVIPSGAFKIVPASFAFGDNTGKNIGSLGDDFIQIALRLPVGSVSDVSVTDYILTPGIITITDFPQTPDSVFCNESVTPAVPNYDGMDLYLPMKLTPRGTFYDNSEIGEIIEESNLSIYVNSLHPTSNKMLTDGNQYATAGYSPLGIPFARLQSEYWDESAGIPLYGTGKSYFVAVLVSATNQIILANNSPGIATPPVDGTPPTGFTFSTIHTGIAPASGYFCTCIQPTGTEVYIVNSEPGSVGAGHAGTAPVVAKTARQGSSIVNQITSFEITGPIGPDDYFTFQTSNGGVQDWYAWFKVDGTGTDPAPVGRTGILINLHAGDAISVVAQKITAALNNWQATSILTVAASAITSGDYFTANAITPGGDEVEFYAWYKKDGVGTDPKPSGKEGIEVDIVTADTAIQVAQKTQVAINMKYFASPNYKDLFFRGQGAGVNRYPYTFGETNAAGSLQLDDNLQHDHAYIEVSTGSGEIAGGSDTSLVFTSEPTSESGGPESRPVNVYVNRAVRY